MGKKIDIYISGGGLSGLIAAVAFGQSGFSVVCADPAPLPETKNSQGADLRTTAYLQPGQDLLNRLGVWARVADHAAALDVMRIVDISGTDATPRDFVAQDITDAPFGWNVGNWTMRSALVDHLASLPNVTFLSGVATKTVLTRTDMAKVALTNGQHFDAKLVIGADGRDSPIRQGMGIDAPRTDFGQMAVSFAVTHAVPHQNISTEVHRSGGPFTLVPLPDHNGSPCSAVVWMETTGTAQTLATMDEDQFNAAATERSGHVLGDLTLATRRMTWPIISQLTDSFVGERTALIAEAAHVVPPIGAQGLNMSLADIETLLDLALANPSDLGTRGMLETYHRQRHMQVHARMAGVGALNRISMLDISLAQTARAAGLRALHGLPTLRKSAMRLGLGTR